MECEQLYRGDGYNTSGITPDGSKYLRPAPGGSSAFRTEVRVSAAPGAAFSEWRVIRSERHFDGLKRLYVK